MPERVEKHGDVRVVVGTPQLEQSAGELCPRCGVVIQERSFLWQRPERRLALRLFVEACYCGIRYTDATDQPLDQTPELWGMEGSWRCRFCGFATDDPEAFHAHRCDGFLEPPGGRTSVRGRDAL
jgi:hypothetical protein